MPLLSPSILASTAPRTLQKVLKVLAHLRGRLWAPGWGSHTSRQTGMVSWPEPGLSPPLGSIWQRCAGGELQGPSGPQFLCRPSLSSKVLRTEPYAFSRERARWGCPASPWGGSDPSACGALTSWPCSYGLLGLFGACAEAQGKYEGVRGGGWQRGREGTSGGIITESTLLINFNQFKACFLGIKLHCPSNIPGPEGGSRCLCLSRRWTCLA